MLTGWVFVVTVVALLGTGLTAGALFAFSSFVMGALARLPAPEGMRAMQSINERAPRPAFMLPYVGTAVLDAVLVVVAVINWDEAYAPYLLAAAVVYVVGVIGLTGGYHVPRNNALGELDAGAPSSVERWTKYVRDWTTWNHVRVAAALASAALLTIAVHAT